jgi:hypothetical protein
MEIDRFWEIIELSRRKFRPDASDGNMERQRQELETLLSKLSPDDVIAFDRQLIAQMNIAYRWDLWGAAYIIAGGCSDDGFVDFRGWLISMGRQVFESAMADVESLVDIASRPGIEDVLFEGFINVPDEVYEQLTGREIPEDIGLSFDEPAGDRWSPTGQELRRRFPRLWSKYGVGTQA